MVKQFKPKNESSKIFNVSNFNYLQGNITVDAQQSTDEAQNQLVKDMVATSNTLTTQIATNATASGAIDAKVTALEGKTVNVDLAIEDDAEQEALELLLLDKNVKITGDLRVRDNAIQCGPVDNRIMLAKGLYSTNKGIKLNYNNTDDCGEIECQKLHVRHSLKLNGVDIEVLNNKVTAIDTGRRIRCHIRITGDLTTLESTNCTATKSGWGSYQVTFGAEAPPNKHYHVVATGSHDGTAFTQFQISQDLSTGLAKFIVYSRDVDFVKVDMTTGTYNISVSW